MTPSVSVIIPVWNAASYLRRCLDSVLAQTLSSVEIICADDASTDNSLAILREYTARDTRLRVASLPAKAGTSVARNTALALARGEYIGFVDSDDAVDPNFYEKLYTIARASNADIVKGNVLEYSVNGKTQEKNINPKIRANRWFFWEQWWAAIYSARMLQECSLRFHEDLAMSQDVVFLTQALLCAKTVITVDDTLYHNYIRADSTSHFFTEERGASDITARKRILCILHDIFVAHKEEDSFRKIFFAHFMEIFHLGTYLQQPERVQYMAEIFCALYAACPFPDYVDEHLPIAALRPLLQHNDAAGVAALAARLTPGECRAARLRMHVRLQWQGRAAAGKPCKNDCTTVCSAPKGAPPCA